MYIKAKNIWKSYRNRLGHIDRHVLTGLDLDVEKGQRVAIMGPSGSGKTTLLNLLGSLDRPDQGTISIGGQVISSMNTDEVRLFRSCTAGFIFQFHHLLPQCTMWENVLLPAIPLRQDKTDLHQRAEELLSFLNIFDKRDHMPGELSGGECQRVAVARALINSPELLLADEPTGSLDTNNAGMLIDMLIRINQEMGVTLVVATHSHAIASRMDVVCQLDAGVLKK